MKKISSIILSIALTLTLVGCGTPRTALTAADWQEASADTIAGFDQRLLGCWQCHDNKQISGNSKLQYASLSFFYDGSCFGSLINIPDLHSGEIIEARQKGISPPKATTKDGTLDMFGSYCDYFEKTHESMTEEDSEKLELYRSFTCTYSFENAGTAIQKQKQEDYGEFYKEYDNDILVLHITGEQQASPIETKIVDATFRFEKQFPTYGYDWFEYSMEGVWKDTSENLWDFRLEPDRSSYDLVVSMTDTDGQFYENGDMTNFTRNDTQEYVRFSFSGNNHFNSPDYKIISFDGIKLSLEDENGEPFELVRQVPAQ